MEKSNVGIICRKKSVLLYIDGYIYYKHSGVFRRYWNCRNKGECFARAVTIGDGDTLTICKGPKSSPHNHSPNYDAVDAAKILTSMKRKAVEHPEMTPCQIIRSKLDEITSEILVELPVPPNLRRIIIRCHEQNKPPSSPRPVKPTRISDVEEASNVGFIHGRKNVFLYIDGYTYYKHSGVSRRYWNCRKKRECFARAVTTGDGDTLIICKGPKSSLHNHPPSFDTINAEKLLTYGKEKAVLEQPEITPAQVYAAKCEKLN